MRRKIAVTVPEEIVAKVERAVSEGRAPSMSAFVSQALEEKIGSGRRVSREEFLEFLDEMDRRLGPPGKEAEEWADRVLGLSSSTQVGSSRSKRRTGWPERSSGAPLIVELPSSSPRRSSRKSGATRGVKRGSRA